MLRRRLLVDQLLYLNLQKLHIILHSTIYSKVGKVFKAFHQNATDAITNFLGIPQKQLLTIIS